MRSIGLGFGLTRGSGGISAAFSVTLTGLSSDSLGSYGPVGAHASVGYTIAPDNGTETVKWSNSSNPADAATYGTGAAPTDYTASDDSTIYLHVTDGGETVTRAFGVRYTAGSVTESALADWTIDDDVLNVNLASDFTTTNLTGSYVITGLPSGAADDGDGTISGTADGAPESTSITATFTDQYGRTIVGTYPITTVYRTQATAAGGLGPYVWEVDDGDVLNIDFKTDFTANGNTLSYVITGLPTGVSDDGDGTISGEATVVGQNGTITITATDEYGRTTVSSPTYSTDYRPQAADPSISTQNITVDDDTVNIDASATANGNTLTYVLTTALGSATINSSTGAITVPDNGGAFGSGDVGTGNMVVTATDEYARDTVYNVPYNVSLRTQATAAGALDLSFVESSAITPTDLSTDWTANGNTLTFTAVDSLPSGLSLSTAGSLTGTPTSQTADANYTIRATDEYGRVTDSEVAIEITSASSSPTLDTLTFTDNNDGTPASLALTYSGDVTGYRVYIATGTSSIAVNTTQLYAGSGGTGTLEFADYAVGSDIDITGLTSTSNSAVRISAVLITSSDGSNPSNVRTVTVSGLDFTAPTFSSAEVGTINANTLEITTSETLSANSSPNASDFTLTGNTISAASIVGGKIRLTLGTTVTGSDDYTGDLSYTQSAGSIVDADGNELANFASQNVTNNVGGGGAGLTYLGQYSTADSVSSTSIDFTSVTLGTGTIYAFVSNRDGGEPTSVSAPTGSPAIVTDGVTSASQDGYSDNRVTCWSWSSTSGSGTVTVNAGASMRWASIRLYLDPDNKSVDTVVASRTDTGDAAPWQTDLSLATSSGGDVMVGYSTYNETAGTTDLDRVAGVTLDTDAGDTAAPTGIFNSYSATGTATETRTVGVGDDNTGAIRNAGVAVAIS